MDLERIPAAVYARPLDLAERTVLLDEALAYGRMGRASSAYRYRATGLFYEWLQGTSIEFDDMVTTLEAGQFDWDHLLTWSTERDLVSDWSFLDVPGPLEGRGPTRLAGRLIDGAPRVVWRRVTEFLSVPCSDIEENWFELDSTAMSVPFGNEFWLRAFLDIVGSDASAEEAATGLQLVADTDKNELEISWRRHGEPAAMSIALEWVDANRALLSLVSIPNGQPS